GREWARTDVPGDSPGVPKGPGNLLARAGRRRLDLTPQDVGLQVRGRALGHGWADGRPRIGGISPLGPRELGMEQRAHPADLARRHLVRLVDVRDRRVEVVEHPAGA